MPLANLATVAVAVALVLVVAALWRLFLASREAAGRLTQNEAGLQDAARRLGAAERRAADLAAAVETARKEVAATGQELRDRMAGVETRINQQVRDVETRIEDLRRYLQQVFEKDLKEAMVNFDRTVIGVLGEMKDELLQGVGRIEGIEQAVARRGHVDDLLTARSEQARRLLGQQAEAHPAWPDLDDGGEGDSESQTESEAPVEAVPPPTAEPDPPC